MRQHTREMHVLPSSDQTRAPKHIGDFGEGLVTYAFVRKEFEVAKVDHVGADLIAEYDCKRFAVSVKTRYYRPGSVETRAALLSHDDIKKLNHFAKQFGLSNDAKVTRYFDPALEVPGYSEKVTA